MGFKFENLTVYHLSLDYLDILYKLGKLLPRSEDFNLKSQMIRAGTSIVLNIAEGSTSCSNAEQIRYLKTSIRSLIETVACQHLIQRREYVSSERDELKQAYSLSEHLFKKLQAFCRTLI
ncbi:MAG TPA: four helix bundle protein [bacterium]|nr:four helix bundle protein [bacterium]